MAPPRPWVWAAPSRRPPMAALPLNVLCSTVKVPPWLKTPPPWARLPGAPRAWFWDTITWLRLRLPPAFQMPPPLSARPCVIVRSSMSTVAPLPIRKTRLASIPFAEAQVTAICYLVFITNPSIREAVTKMHPERCSLPAGEAGRVLDRLLLLEQVIGPEFVRQVLEETACF